MKEFNNQFKKNTESEKNLKTENLKMRFNMTYNTFPQKLYCEYIQNYVVPYGNNFKECIDLGCGSGGLLREVLKVYNCKAIGIDVSGPAINDCLNDSFLQKHNTKFIQDDILNFTNKKSFQNRFDLIVSHSVFHLIEGDTANKFKLLKNISKPGAIIYLDAPPFIMWNAFFLKVAKIAYKMKIAEIGLRLFRPLLVPNRPKSYIKEATKLSYIKDAKISTYLDLSYFNSEDFHSSFEILRKDIIPNDGILTARKVRLTIKRKELENNKSKIIKNINEIFHDLESKNYDERHPEIIVGERKWWNQLSNKYIKNNTKKSRIILDIATGNGFVPNIVLNYLNNNDKIIGHDLSLEMLKQSKIKIKNNNFHTIQGDAEKLSFKNKSIDIITINTAIHHFPDLQTSLKEIDRVLKKEGILIIGREPNKKFFDSFMVKILTKMYNFVWGIKMDKDMKNEINKKLKERGLINKDLSGKEIIGFVEYNSIPEHEGIKSTDDNFSPDNLLEFFKNYEVLEYSTISTFIYRSIFPFKNTLNKILKKILNNEGSMFSLILKKK